MTETLFPFQVEGANFLSTHSHALLADEMGLGKSAQAITACDLVNAKRILVVCPAAARINWEREFKKFSPRSHSFVVVESSKGLEGHFKSEKSLIISYPLIPNDPATSIKEAFDVLILDECHFLKSIDAKRAKNVYGKNGLVRRAKRVWCLSGTPAPNHAGELWPMLFTFGRTPLSYEAFISRFCTSYVSPSRQFQKQITGTNESRIPMLKELLSPIMLRRRKDQVMKELPDIFYGEVTVEPCFVDLELSKSYLEYFFPKDRSMDLYEEIDKQKQLVDSMLEIRGMGEEGLKALDAIASSVSMLRRYTGMQKIKGAAALIRQELETNQYEKIVIFAVHQDVVEGMRRELKDFDCVTLYGRTPVGKRQGHIDRFQNHKKCRVFIGNIIAAGTAITLTAAHNVVFVEQDWVPGNNAQAAMRCHRIGQTKPVLVRFISLVDSFDEKIAQALKRKTRQLTALFDSDRKI